MSEVTPEPVPAEEPDAAADAAEEEKAAEKQAAEDEKAAGQ